MYCATAALVLVASSFIGSTDWSLADVWHSWQTGDGVVWRRWFDFRIRRLVYVASVGAVLATSGVVFQAALKNALAEPYILGVSNGASLGTLAAIVWLPASWTAAIGFGSGTWGVTACAFAGSLAAIGVLFLMIRVGRFRDAATVVLCGVVLNAVFAALILLLFSLASQSQALQSLHFLMGTIDLQVVLGTPHSPLLAVVSVASLAFFAATARHLDLLALSDDEARDLGLSPERFRGLVLTVASLATGIAVAGAGPIGFVGLVAPHIVRRLHGATHRHLLVLSWLGGAIFLMLADTVARAISVVRVLPIGVVTALIGGPFLLVLLSRGRRVDVDE